MIVEASSKRKIVFIDKPFISKTFTNYDLNVIYHKLLVKSAFLFAGHSASYDFEKAHSAATLELDDDSSDPDMAEVDDPFGASSEALPTLDDLETFGTVTSSKKEENESGFSVHPEPARTDQSETGPVCSDQSVPEESSSAGQSECGKIDVDESQLDDNLLNQSLPPILSPIDESESEDADTQIQSTDCPNIDYFPSSSKMDSDSILSDDEDVRLAIDLDQSSPSPIMSTDGQFDDPPAVSSTGSGQARRRSGRLQGRSTTTGTAADQLDTIDQGPPNSASESVGAATGRSQSSSDSETGAGVGTRHSRRRLGDKKYCHSIDEEETGINVSSFNGTPSAAILMWCSCRGAEL